MDAPTTHPAKSGSRSTYVVVFLALAAVTLLEILLSNPASSLAGPALNGLFLLLSLAKASLVAAFFMHLKYESRLYTYILVLPVVLLLIFTYLASLS